MYEDVDQYVQFVVRSLWRLYRDWEADGTGPVARLGDPAVVPRVRRQVDMLYHVLL